MTDAQTCPDCARLGLTEQRPTRYCSWDGLERCREHRTKHLERLGVGAPVTQPRPTQGHQERFA